MNAPEGWERESFALPLDFAPEIDFVGNEEILFAPEWDDSSSPQFWTYTFSWYFDIDKEHNAEEMAELLERYFTGLSKSTAESKGLDVTSKDNAIAALQSEGSSGTTADFTGSIEFYDAFFSMARTKLNVRASEILCPEMEKQLIVFQFSGQPYGEDEWQLFDTLNILKDCESIARYERNRVTRVKNENYELVMPKSEINGVLVLFPGFPENPEIVQREFPISEMATSKKIAVAFMDFNQRIWLEVGEKVKLASVLQEMFSENALPTNNIYIGGFSSGGNVSLLISDYLSGLKSELRPKGVFIVDSPIDILGLYVNSKKNIERDMSDVSVQESKMVVDLLESNFGKPDKGISEYEEYSVYTTKTHNTDNLSNLGDTKIRLYTEPDIAWWKENRGYEYEEMNSYFMENLAKDLSAEGGYAVEYIVTEDRGYRSNGNRHPHSWSIVDMKELLEWISKE